MQRLRDERAAQTLLMSNINILISLITRYNGHILLENPTHSKFWKQPFMRTAEAIVSKNHILRYFLLNRCRVGGKHFKQYKFFTSLPRHATSHMELTCDHSYRHPPCLGKDANGNSVTKASGVYTDDMVSMICAVIATMSETSKLTVKDVSNHAHAAKAGAHECYKCEMHVPFELATSASYTATTCRCTDTSKDAHKYVKHPHDGAQRVTSNNSSVNCTNSQHTAHETHSCSPPVGAPTPVLGGGRAICG